MAPPADLVGMVDRIFESTAPEFPSWPDPHPHRSPRDEEYSRVTDAGKWRIVGARADAWLAVVEEANLAIVERHAAVRWLAEPGTQISRLDRAVPTRAGALPLTVARSRICDVADAGVTFGVGDPAVCVGWIPACGCDACDSGSQNELDEVDRLVIGVVSGTFRRLTSGTRQITQLDGTGWSALGSFGHSEVDAILANPRGWKELAGSPWFSSE